MSTLRDDMPHNLISLFFPPFSRFLRLFAATKKSPTFPIEIGHAQR
jgi:hypothetical protein